MNDEYPIPTESVTYHEEIKKSRFIVHLAHTPTIEDAKAFIKQIQHQYPDARHNCWAYVAGEPGGSHVLGFSDDGEPNGTAGKPMLNVLAGSGIGEICAVITRYFGGIKLGTGGLVRAYGGSLNNALRQLQTELKVPVCEIQAQSNYNFQGVIESVLSRYNTTQINKDYAENIHWQVLVDMREQRALIEEVYEATHSQVLFKLQCDGD